MNTIFIPSHSSRYPFVRLIGLAVLILACGGMLIQASPTGEGHADTCRATVGVAVTKADKLSGESFTANLSRSISTQSGINAIPVLSVASKRFRFAPRSVNVGVSVAGVDFASME
jgi:hypothetical protein